MLEGRLAEKTSLKVWSGSAQLGTEGTGAREAAQGPGLQWEEAKFPSGRILASLQAPLPLQDQTGTRECSSAEARPGRGEVTKLQRGSSLGLSTQDRSSADEWGPSGARQSHGQGQEAQPHSLLMGWKLCPPLRIGEPWPCLQILLERCLFKCTVTGHQEAVW